MKPFVSQNGAKHIVKAESTKENRAKAPTLAGTVESLMLNAVPGKRLVGLVGLVGLPGLPLLSCALPP